MKKFIVAVLALVMLLAVAAVASAAETASFKIYNAPCVAISDSDLYKYHGDAENPATKRGYDKSVYIKHKVSQITADETNRIAAYDCIDAMTMGAHWHPSDYALYPRTSNAIERLHTYTGAGRVNTNYESKYGLNTITIEGFIDPDYD